MLIRGIEYETNEQLLHSLIVEMRRPWVELARVFIAVLTKYRGASVFLADKSGDLGRPYKVLVFDFGDGTSARWATGNASWSEDVVLRHIEGYLTDQLYTKSRVDDLQPLIVPKAKPVIVGADEIASCDEDLRAIERLVS